MKHTNHTTLWSPDPYLKGICLAHLVFDFFYIAITISLPRKQNCLLAKLGAYFMSGPLRKEISLNAMAPETLMQILSRFSETRRTLQEPVAITSTSINTLDAKGFKSFHYLTLKSI